MNPSFLKYSFGLLIPVALSLSISGCSNKSDSDEKGLFTKADEKEVKTDSLYILNYISQVPDFKKQKELMYLFYGDRDYKLAWFRGDNLVPEADKFLEAVNNASKEGLDPKQYKLVDFPTLIKQYEEADDSVKIELQKKIDVGLTASYFHYASDFYTGRVDPKADNTITWDVKKNKIKLHKALQTILRERESTYPYYEFEALHAGYSKLRDKLKEYRTLEQKGGWQKVELGNLKSIKKGDTTQVVLALRKRLDPFGKLNVNDPKMRLYDAQLETQVKKFQALHGLDTDGVVGGHTLKTMNIPVSERIQQIMINMERWRWIPKRMVPKSLDQRYIWVNIPEYKLYIYEDEDGEPDAERAYKKVMEMRVIVGKTMNSTPIFSDKLEYVVLAPYWNVPNSIVEKEIKPKMLNNPGWLANNNMEIVTKEKEPKPISESSIDWAGVTEKNFPYMVREKPGPKNSLGSIKFLFPNEYAVYLHDTPADALFAQTERNFSHGCVRVEKPVELAKYLLKGMNEWDESSIRETMNGGEEKWITLPKQVQVYLVYFTSWVDENGDIHFREDLYKHDKKLEQEYFG
ncbi:L,D-transpeptidase family protein [Pontibacter arcticus]|uniref:L,D-TPase catalytic domain-containing protein n=1 Tax=Pontibacter arcticus TaxID=2080288 RepID=A0A364RGC2_9BACT|nr:L,D-transpeptidase family protein [Pontibacter arcticus]RAU83322.1 hypothetical protein DP923_08935 [Pontibacter arcticus]